MQQVLRGVTELSIDGIVPSPVSGLALVRVFSASRQEATVSVIDALGRIVMTTPAALSQDANTIALDLTTLPAGIYAVRLEADGVAASRMFVRER